MRCSTTEQADSGLGLADEPPAFFEDDVGSAGGQVIGDAACNACQGTHAAGTNDHGPVPGRSGSERRIEITRLVNGEGDIFMLPPGMPHSPQRFADTVGLVVERQRKPDELDGFMWFCEQCDNKLYEEFLPVSDIVRDLPPIFDRFWSDEAARTCANCGAVLSPD